MNNTFIQYQNLYKNTAQLPQLADLAVAATEVCVGCISSSLLDNILHGSRLRLSLPPRPPVEQASDPHSQTEYSLSVMEGDPGERQQADGEALHARLRLGDPGRLPRETCNASVKRHQ